MPPEMIVYVEIGSPGQQVETILNMLKGTPLENPFNVISMTKTPARPEAIMGSGRTAAVPRTSSARF